MGSNAPRDDLESTFIFSCGINGCCGSDISYPLVSSCFVKTLAKKNGCKKGKEEIRVLRGPSITRVHVG